MAHICERIVPACRAGAALLALALVACNPGKSGSSSGRPMPAPQGQPVGTPVTAEVGPQGATLASSDGRLTLRIPAGAVATTTSFSIQEITNTARGGVGSAYRLEPSGTTFATPVVISFSALNVDAALEDLAIAFQDESGYWSSHVSILRNRAARLLTVTSAHFSAWTMVSTDPTRDFGGSFTLNSNLDVPFTANGISGLAYGGEDSTERYYLLSGTTTLLPVTKGGAVCTPELPPGAVSGSDPAVYTFPTNLAEVFSNPAKFWWGTSAHWNLTCGTAPTYLLETAFDTVGLNNIGCFRGYTSGAPAPIISADELKGDYTVECPGTGGGALRAVWDFQRCGAPCVSTNPCATSAQITCTSAGPTCTVLTTAAAGTSCTTTIGTAGVCSTSGSCVECAQGAACTSTDPCAATATIECSSGAPVCTDRTLKPVGTACTSGSIVGVCNGTSTQCIACTQSQTCTSTNPCAATATIECSSGAPVCTDRTYDPAGAACTSGSITGVCSATTPSTCVACSQGAACTSTDPCAATATVECSSGAPVCTARTVKTVGTSCTTSTGAAGVCNGTSSQCVACTQGQTCTSTNPCDATATIECSSGAPVCTDRTFKTAGTACTSGSTVGVCSTAGVCTSCTQGQACTSTNPCDATATIECTSGAPVCTDRTYKVAGTSCSGGGVTGVCSASTPSTCTACTQDQACASSNPCTATATIECSSGAPVCTDRTWDLAGTACTSGSITGVCSATTPSACAACTQDAPCVSGDPCAATATIECSSGAPVCTDRTLQPAGTLCTSGGVPGVCSGSSAQCTACSQGAACTSADPCAATASIECSSGAPVCTDRTFQPAGTACAGGVCSGSSALCTSCTQNATCTSADPCAATASIECSSGAPVCTDRTFKTAGTACTTSTGGVGVCGGTSGACGACTQGAACTSTDTCAATATIECSSGAPVCTDRTFQPAGTGCTTSIGGPGVCSGASGSCGACTQGAACTSSDPCAATATIECSSGAPVCADRTFKTVGTACTTSTGGPGVCDGTSGACGACDQGGGCLSSNPCAATATIECSSGAPVCTDRTYLPGGTSCPSGVCSASTPSTCSACTQGAACTSGDPCAASSTIECSSGAPVCTDRTFQSAGTSCTTSTGGAGVCSGTSGACGACSQGAACTSSNPCAATATIECSSGAPVCTDRTYLPGGTSCPSGVCSASTPRTCTACPQGQACTSSNTCVATAAIDCSTGAAVCTDQTFLSAGTSCDAGGTSGVCSATTPSTCTSCTQGATCTSSNPCAATATIDCTSGAPVCTVASLQPAGTFCLNGTTAGVCSSTGVCTACQEGAACTSSNPCAATATIECSSGAPVCTDRTFRATGQTCTTSTGASGVCDAAGACTACAQGAACTSSNPCAATATIECSSGAPVCTDRTYQAAGSSCSSGGTTGVCSATTPSTCTACTQGAACTSSNSCAATATIDCSSGAPVCTARTFRTAGQTCTTSTGASGVCDASGTCTACAQGAACTSTNPCAVSSTIECSSGAPVCTDRSFTTAGTSCDAGGTAGVCSPAGTCSPCPQGQACTSANPCAATATIECSSGAPVCTDRTLKPAGTDCTSGGTAAVCSPSGICTTCTQGAACTPTEVCVTSATTVCTSGAPVCTATAIDGDGAVCDPGATGSSVCLSGQCALCLDGASCIPSTNPCDVGTMQCALPANGTNPAVPPTCLDTGATAVDGTECNVLSGSVCLAGTCSACVEGTACITATCNAGTLSCAGATPSCVDSGTAATCPAGQTCTSGVCR